MPEEECKSELHRLCKEVSLYKSYYISNMILDDDEPMNCYCTECKDDSVFQRNRNYRIVTSRGFEAINLKLVSYQCARNGDHQIWFIYFVNDGNVTTSIIKIGQYPSMADLATGEINDYRKILGDSLLSEFKMAIRLNANGVGVGSFVYLRRIFESLVNEAHDEAVKSDNWDDTGYDGLKTENKIKKLRSFLPNSLVTNKKLYGILSKGIHELTEDECKLHFHIVKAGIEIILEQKLHEIKKAAKEKEVEKSIQELHGKLKQSKSSSESNS